MFFRSSNKHGRTKERTNERASKQQALCLLSDKPFPLSAAGICASRAAAGGAHGGILRCRGGDGGGGGAGGVDGPTC